MSEFHYPGRKVGIAAAAAAVVSAAWKAGKKAIPEAIKLGAAIKERLSPEPVDNPPLSDYSPVVGDGAILQEPVYPFQGGQVQGAQYLVNTKWRGTFQPSGFFNYAATYVSGKIFGITYTDNRNYGISFSGGVVPVNGFSGGLPYPENPLFIYAEITGIIRLDGTPLAGDIAQGGNPAPSVPEVRSDNQANPIPDLESLAKANTTPSVSVPTSAPGKIGLGLRNPVPTIAPPITPPLPVPYSPPLPALVPPIFPSPFIPIVPELVPELSPKKLPDSLPSQFIPVPENVPSPESQRERIPFVFPPTTKPPECEKERECLKPLFKELKEDLEEEPEFFRCLKITVTTKPYPEKRILSGNVPSEVLFAGYVAFTYGSAVGEEVAIRREITIVPFPDWADGYRLFPQYGAVFSAEVLQIAEG